MLELNDVINHMYLTGIYNTFHPHTKEYTTFSALHETFSGIDHILGYKSSLTQYRKIEITLCNLSAD